MIIYLATMDNKGMGRAGAERRLKPYMRCFSYNIRKDDFEGKVVTRCERQGDGSRVFSK